MMKKLAFLFLVMVTACQAPPAKQTDIAYPDLKAYFRKEIRRLEKTHPEVLKEVQLNQQKEIKTLRKLNWEQELALFLSSDINKPAYKGLYRMEKNGLEESYTATGPQLKTREIKLRRKPNGQIEKIEIINHSKNSLYSSDEHLEYYPDSLYQIVKRQKVLLMGSHHYRIIGRFKK